MKKKKVSLRRCVGCTEMKPKSELLRVIRTPDDEYMLDETGKQNGRGSYLCKSSECGQNAYKNRGFQRSFKSEIPVEVYEKLAREIETIEQG